MASLAAIHFGEQACDFSAPKPTFYTMMCAVSKSSSPEMQRIRAEFDQDLLILDSSELRDKWSRVVLNLDNQEWYDVKGDIVGNFQAEGFNRVTMSPPNGAELSLPSLDDVC